MIISRGNSCLVPGELSFNPTSENSFLVFLGEMLAFSEHQPQLLG